MASKGHVDSSVAERRLRPVYNWLDDGNNKKALQEADKVLKKRPGLQCAKVLKALALLRLGKENECHDILESVRSELQCDDATLQALTICYREMNRPEAICEVYSTVLKNDPKNEELLTHLFMAYVRVCDYKKQQQTGMTLYKLKLKNHYYFWTVMSIVMQAHEAGPELARNLQLPLAEKMVKKMIEDGKIEAEQEVQLYLLILEMQNKLEEALNVLEGPLGEMLNSYPDVQNKRIELLVKTKSWTRANILIKELLMNDMDNWNLYLNYFKTVFNLVDLECNGNGILSSTDDAGGIDNKTIQHSVQFLSDILTKNQSQSQCLRGPYLAILEFSIQLQDKGINFEPYFGSFTDLLLSYFRKFGSKPCCLSDLKPYLDKLDKSQIATLLDRIWKFIELEDGQLPTSKDQMLKYISNLHITRYLGFHEKLSREDKTQLASCLFRYYIHGAQFNGSSLLPTDIRHNDPYIILIVEILNDVWLDTNDSEYLTNAILVLEFALEKSPSNHQFKILLIKIYNSIGCSNTAHRVYELVDIKHVQLDSMGYLQCWPLLSSGQYVLASNVFETTLKFFTSNYKDSADHLTFLYKFGSFLKINEFIEFRERLNNSLHYSAVTVEKMILEILTFTSYDEAHHLINKVMCIDPEKDSIQFEKLEDNRDLNLCWTSEPRKGQSSEELVTKTFEHDVELLRVRSLILRIMAAVVQLSSNCISSSGTLENGNYENSSEAKNTLLSVKALEYLSQQLTFFSNSVKQKTFTRLQKNLINAAIDSRLFLFIELPYIEFVELFVHLTLAAAKGDIAGLEDDVSSELRNPLSRLMQVISLLNAECKSVDHTQLQFRLKLLNRLTVVTEMVMIACLFCGALSELVKLQTAVHQGKKGKKRKDSAPSAQSQKDNLEKGMQCSTVVQKMLISTKSAVQDLVDCVNLIESIWREPINSFGVSWLMENIDGEDASTDHKLKVGNTSKFKKYEGLILKNMRDSYQSSCLEILNVLEVKCKFVSRLKI